MDISLWSAKPTHQIFFLVVEDRFQVCTGENQVKVVKTDPIFNLLEWIIFSLLDFLSFGLYDLNMVTPLII
jgi:hypothetical protein